MKKPVLAICEQQRCRSACASAQSDQHLCCSLLRSYITPLVSISKLSRLWLVSVAEQVSLSLIWSQTPKIGFLVTSSYCNGPKFADRYAWANSADPDQTAPRGAGSTLFAIPSASFGLITLW